jgi:hypothetical protein
MRTCRQKDMANPVDMFLQLFLVDLLQMTMKVEQVTKVLLVLTNCIVNFNILLIEVSCMIVQN